LARVIAADVKNDEREIVLVEGIRRLADIAELLNFPNFYLVSMDADQKIRYDRLIKRNENIGDSEKTFKQFESDGQQEAELQIPAVMAQAKYHLDNKGPLEELYRQLDNLMADLNK
jgi:dephospho-CoA kinase